MMTPNERRTALDAARRITWQGNADLYSPEFHALLVSYRERMRPDPDGIMTPVQVAEFVFGGQVVKVRAGDVDALLDVYDRSVVAQGMARAGVRSVQAPNANSQ